MTHIVIAGPMGAGKTTVGRAVAASRGMTFADSDADIEAATGETGRTIAARDGVAALHAHERAVLRARLDDPEPAVIAAAGSVVDDADARSALATAFVVWLDAPLVVLAERWATDDHRRSIEPAELRRLDAARRPHYEAIADLRLDALRPVEELVAAVGAALDQA